jgi:hypothetical protein
MPDEMWHVQIAGQRFGEMTAAAILQRLQDGSLNPEGLVFRQGMVDWAPLSTIPEFGGTPPPPMPDDAGPFRRIGTTFYLDGQEWVGRTLVSPSSLYLLKSRSLEGIHISGSLVGTVIRTTMGAFTQSRADIRTCAFAELPVSVRSQLDPKGKRITGTAVVVRKAAVEFVKVPKIHNVITFSLGGQRVSVVTSWFGVRKVGRWLAENGWTLNQPLEPTEAPIHGADFRRSSEDLL